jgi:hypothetical protein
MPAGNSDKNQARSEPEIAFELGSLQIFEDHDTRGDSRYPPVKEPRDVPRTLEEWRQRRQR